MNKVVRFYQDFTKRMLFLSLLTGLIIAVSMPLSHLLLTFRDASEQVSHYSQHLAWMIRDKLERIPDTWPLPQERLEEIITESKMDDTIAIHVYDQDRQPLYARDYLTPSSFDISYSSPIMHGESILGFVVVSGPWMHELYKTGVLFAAFSGLGLVMGIVLYQLPARIIHEAKNEIDTAFQKLYFLSHYDSLTKLPNRRSFRKTLQRIVEEARERGEKVAVMFLDVDRFKQINDTLGHSLGDLLLRCVAERLQACVRQGDTVARLSGDEFTVILPNIQQLSDVDEIARQILSTMATPLILEGQELFVTCSIGISIFPDDGDCFEEILQNADLAMYRSKESGKNRFHYYTASLNYTAYEKLKLENELRKSLAREEFLLHYQPRIDLASHKIISVEALVRWQHPEMGLVAPAKFIPLAEETGLIIPLGEWVLRTACKQNKAWQTAGHPPIPIAVNLSVQQFQQKDLVETIERILVETDLSPHYLELEVTESIPLLDVNSSIDKLKRLKDRGIKISIDDFGTGYSSLHYLKRFPIHALKIDRTFVHNLTIDPYDSDIITCIIAMAHSLRVKVIAEGVETEAQRSFLVDQNCDEIQGFLFSPPVPSDEMAALFTTFGTTDELDSRIKEKTLDI
ncbi:putative bifunctional diguanylate cyclase/phosphodiesterase [Brevibacillus dissolubilis]|uniref:putative bifunctional diguanylate cyclase/phosphodiesterase n=1 Tax=Brevibacillus dissolubilis TaxID=1844116 RepID=UPI001116C2BC|nr:EAL domain-containing protein [Brevibacillus dissolubilis]